MWALNTVRALLIPMDPAYEGARPAALASRAAGRLTGFLLVMGVLVTTLGGCRTPQNEPSTLVTLYHSPEKLPPLPFVVFPADTGGRVYRNPMWGIEILGVWADGKRIQPEPLFIDFDQLPDPFTVRVSADLFVYRVQSSELGPDTPLEADHWFGVFASKMTSDDYNVERYAVPHKSSQVEVQYRARGKSYRGVGRVMTLRLLKYDPNRKPAENLQTRRRFPCFRLHLNSGDALLDSSSAATSRLPGDPYAAVPGRAAYSAASTW